MTKAERAERLRKRKKYFQKMFGGVGGKSVKKRARRAFKLAHDIRKFEIDLYWRRSLYFWGFQVAMFVALATLISGDDLSKNGALKYFLAILFSFSGFVMAVAWYHVNEGSKAWQENWEYHIDLLEDEFSGRLYKTIIKDEKNFYSVSKINTLVSVFVTFIWIAAMLTLWSFQGFFCLSGLPEIFGFWSPAILIPSVLTVVWCIGKRRATFDKLGIHPEKLQIPPKRMYKRVEMEG